MLDSAYSVSVPVPLGGLPSLRSEIIVVIVPFARRHHFFVEKLKERFGSNPPLKSDLLH